MESTKAAPHLTRLEPGLITMAEALTKQMTLLEQLLAKMEAEPQKGLLKGGRPQIQ